ncbi:MAG TPA: hypothetical protein EYG02_11545, partial [Henriciella marina]|nr:hypothetical protein [Henriciella marina]
GMPTLFDGIPLVVSLIGLYSIPEVIDLIDRAKGAGTGAAGIDKTSPFATLRELGRQKLNILRSSLIGIGVGIIPGVGCSVGGFLAYDAAKKSSKTVDCH